jgi:hypothetical protein
MWAMGCVMAELVLRTPLFPGMKILLSSKDLKISPPPTSSGKTDIEQLSLIFNCFGTPISSLPESSNSHPLPANYWPGVESLPNFLLFEERSAEGGFDFSSLLRSVILSPLSLTSSFPRSFRSSSQQSEALALFHSIMQYDPSRRLTPANVSSSILSLLSPFPPPSLI